MALQSSGQIKLSEIATEFGGSEPHSLSEYYDKGNAPSSGEIQLAADFYGTSNYLAEFVISCGTRNIKSGNDEYGYQTTGTGGGSSYGSISSGSAVFGGRTVVGVNMAIDSSGSNTTKIHVIFSGTSNADSVWTSVKVHTTTRDRTAFSGGIINATAYRYSITLGNASLANLLPNGSSRTITFY